jgi:hypothetical protein
MPGMERKKGHYLGTIMDHKWWKRYRKSGMFARGNGEYWLGDDGFYFHRYLTEQPFVILWKRISRIEIGKWHAGRWSRGLPVIKLIWTDQKNALSSGFVLNRSKRQSYAIQVELQQRIDLISNQYGMCSQ